MNSLLEVIVYYAVPVIVALLSIWVLIIAVESYNKARHKEPIDVHRISKMTVAASVATGLWVGALLIGITTAAYCLIVCDQAEQLIALAQSTGITIGMFMLMSWGIVKRINIANYIINKKRWVLLGLISILGIAVALIPISMLINELIYVITN